VDAQRADGGSGMNVLVGVTPMMTSVGMVSLITIISRPGFDGLTIQRADRTVTGWAPSSSYY
jgi:hypothetical protein